MTLLMGAVAYDPKVVSIWTGFRSWLARQELPFDFVLYSNYERQAEDLAAGRLHAAWNSPLAWERAKRLAGRAGRRVWPLVMRDTDQDLTSVVLVRADSPVETVTDLRGQTIAVGAVDSPQATLIPLSWLRSRLGTPEPDLKIVRHDVGVGLHGDHVGGERDAARALIAGRADACCILDTSHLLFTREGTFPPGSVRVLGQTPPYDHCNMTVIDTAPRELVARFGELLRAMSYADPEVRPLLDLEGLQSWRPGRTTGYASLTAAIDQCGFYDSAGGITARDYWP
jgi:ABC-type phosphate/phosphonate transport system substrate-binding protein